MPITLINVSNRLPVTVEEDRLAIAALPAQLSALRTCLVGTLPERKPDLRGKGARDSTGGRFGLGT